MLGRSSAEEGQRELMAERGLSHVRVRIRPVTVVTLEPVFAVLIDRMVRRIASERRSCRALYNIQFLCAGYRPEEHPEPPSVHSRGNLPRAATTRLAMGMIFTDARF